ncbi:MAG: sodium ion-translocating decarboxylase subunit beta, partial [Clostridia bacterium]|nr:sodium ion-translocating decarboxylase subunit beta [Clostridia bacterium]
MLLDGLGSFVAKTGIAKIAMDFTSGGWKTLVMLIIACVLLYLAIVKKFEPLLLLPIAFGMLLANLPLGQVMHPDLFLVTNIDFGKVLHEGGLLDLLYLGVKLGIYPPLIFLGIGCMTDFGPLISNPKSILLGAAAQLGVFITFFCAVLLGAFGIAGFGSDGSVATIFKEAASIGIIGGADGPTAIFVT